MSYVTDHNHRIGDDEDVFDYEEHFDLGREVDDFFGDDGSLQAVHELTE